MEFKGFMSIDATFFAKKAKVRFTADNDYVFKSYFNEDKVFQELEESIIDSSKGLDMESMMVFLNTCLISNVTDEEMEQERKDYAIYWIGQVKEFVMEYKNDTFFMLNNMTDELWDILDYYEEIK